MGIGKKMTKGMIGGGVNLAHKGPKMSGKAKSLESYPGGMPGPGNYGSMDNKIVGKGMMKYMAGEPVGMAKYKSNAQRKAAHASMAEQGAGKYGKHMGPEKALVGKQENLPEALKAKIEAAPGMYGKKKKGMKQMGEMEEPPMSGGPAKMSRKERQERRAEKRVNRGEKRTAKLQKKIDEGKDPEGYKASRLKARKKRVDENKKSVGKDFVSDKDKESNQKDEGPGKYGKKSKGAAKTKKYIQDKEGKIEGKAKRIIGSGSGKVLASRDKKEVGKKYKK